MRYGTRVTLTRTGLLVLLVLFLELAPRYKLVDALTLVPVSAMVKQLWIMVAGGKAAPHFVATGGAIAAAFALSVVAGIPLGILLWRYGWVKRVLDPFLTAYYALPIFALYPLLVSLLGMGYLPVIAIAWAWAVVAVMVNTALGLQEVRPVYAKVARVLRLTRWQAFSRVYFPAATPQIFTGLKLAVTYSVIGVVASEFILAPRGLGWLISYNYNNFGLAEMYASILLLLAVSTVITSTVNRVEARIWRKRA